jgi:hypothetical protein
VDHCYGIMKTYCSVAVSEKFLHARCVPTLGTSSPFIRFWYMSNDWKAQEVSYEFAAASFQEG